MTTPSAPTPSSIAPAPAPLTLDVLNAASVGDFTHRLDGLYEHSPWVMERAAARRPFASAAALKLAVAEVVRSARR